MRSRLIRAAAAALALSLGATSASADMAGATRAYAKLLKDYATPRGVRYELWRSSGTDLKTISEIAMWYRNADPKAMTPEERKALYLNFYNVKILELVLLENPKVSIKELSKGFNALEVFNRRALNFDGKVLSLNDLEKRAFDEFKDPRIHFALCSGSRSCPPLRAEPYRADAIDQQLDDATRKYLALPGVITVRTDGGRTMLTLPRVFDWHSDAFKATGGLPAFLQKYGPSEAAAGIAAPKLRIEFDDYDWSLNAAR
jgi:hypothetical protein